MEVDSWLLVTVPKHRALTDAVTSIMQTLLQNGGIDYLSVTGRTKTESGIREKIKRKGYRNPEAELTDVSGIRVITFFESAVDQIASLIERVFRVDKANSLDKSSALGTDRIGYRSVHFVCDLGDGRADLPEYYDLRGLKFEIQVRTVLQHAWAELAHDRNYKFSSVLPEAIQRKLNLYAGMLEVVDERFDSLATQIDQYVRDVEQRSGRGDLEIEVNSLSLSQFVVDKSKTLRLPIVTFSNEDLAKVIDELRDFGIRTLAQLDALFTEEFVAASRLAEGSTTVLGGVRDLMMFTDIDRYFEQCWKNHWSGTDRDTIEFLSVKYPREKVLKTFTLHGVDVF